MENEVKCVRTLPDDYTPVYLIDRRSPGPMAVILFVAAFLSIFCWSLSPLF